MKEELRRLLKLAEKINMTPEDWEEQKRSFAYGNCKMENDFVTREMVDEVADEMEERYDP